MEFSCDTLDDFMRELYPSLLNAPTIEGSRGKTRSLRELIAVSAEIRQPRARLSRSETRGKAFSALGELIWYLSKGNSLNHILPYIPRYRDESEDEETVYGAYGPRLFGWRGNDQIGNVIKLLRERPSSKRAVVQIFDSDDISRSRVEIPCTSTLQFLVRDEKLIMIVTMRSNDAYWGLPHDIFCFTMIQEIVAQSIGVEMGVYRHYAGSMHIYEENLGMAQQLVDELYQRRIEMPPMPSGEPWEAIRRLVEAEDDVRNGKQIVAKEIFEQDYWADLLRLIQIFHSRDGAEFAELKAAMHFQGYMPYIADRGSKIGNS